MGIVLSFLQPSRGDLHPVMLSPLELSVVIPSSNRPVPGPRKLSAWYPQRQLGLIGGESVRLKGFARLSLSQSAGLLRRLARVFALTGHLLPIRTNSGS